MSPTAVLGSPPDSPQPRFASAWRRARLSAEERVARGKEARKRAPRSSHGAWQPASDRPDPVALLEDQSLTRVPELVPIRHGRMIVSPFTFYRGTALIMAGDLAGTPDSGVTVQLCGDAHLSNFGLFGTPERRLLFDINDFDETLPGPWEWDVKRLAASFEVAGRDRGFSKSDRREIFMAERSIAKARTRDSTRVFAKRAGKVDGELRIVPDPPLIVPLEDLGDSSTDCHEPERQIKELLQAYRQTLAHEHHPVEEFRYIHAARKVVGVRSVGTRCYILLLVGRDEKDPLFLQVKQAEPSVLERFLGRSEHEQHGERVVAGQRLMQAASDLFLGWQRITGLDGHTRDYYVRQLHDWKGSADVDQLQVPGLTGYAEICNATLARAHARWGHRIAIAAYLGRGRRFAGAIADFAVAYADQNERDYEAFVKAVDSGRLDAEMGL